MNYFYSMRASLHLLSFCFRFVQSVDYLIICRINIIQHRVRLLNVCVCVCVRFSVIEYDTTRMPQHKPSLSMLPTPIAPSSAHTFMLYLFFASFHFNLILFHFFPFVAFNKSLLYSKPAATVSQQ